MYIYIYIYIYVYIYIYIYTSIHVYIDTSMRNVGSANAGPARDPPRCTRTLRRWPSENEKGYSERDRTLEAPSPEAPSLFRV